MICCLLALSYLIWSDLNASIPQFILSWWSADPIEDLERRLHAQIKLCFYKKQITGGPSLTRFFTSSDPTTAIFGLYACKWGTFVLVGDPLHCNQICLVTGIIWEKLGNNTNNRNDQFEAKLTPKKVFHTAAVIKFVFSELHVIANNRIKRALLSAKSKQ